MILSIARKELKSMFASPMGWIILAILQLIFGSYYTMSFNQYFEMMAYGNGMTERIGITQFVSEGVFGLAAILLLFVIPLLSMRLISDERKRNTMPFLLSAPVTLTEIVLGKFLSLISYLSILVALMGMMILLLNIWTDIDFYYAFSNLLGLWLLIGAASALGLYFSSLTSEPIVAGMLTFATLIALVLADKFFTENSTAFFHHFSLMQHYKPFSQGLINSHDMIYFLLFSVTFIVLTIRRLNADRLQS